MRSRVPRPFLLVLTLVLIAGAIAFVEFRLDVAGPVSADAQRNSDPPAVEEPAKADTPTAEKKAGPAPGEREEAGARSSGGTRRVVSDVERVAKKADEYRRAEEISNPSGLVNADGFSIGEVAGEKVVLLEFWTYTCFNCQNVQPHLNAWHDAYADDGLQVVGVHTPEFGFEREYANVAAAVREAGIEYPVVLDNSYATWNAYDNRYWPAIYLIDADGFVRYKHFGEGAYDATEEKIEDLLAERARLSG